MEFFQEYYPSFVQEFFFGDISRSFSKNFSKKSSRFFTRDFFRNPSQGFKEPALLRDSEILSEISLFFQEFLLSLRNLEIFPGTVSEVLLYTTPFRESLRHLYECLSRIFARDSSESSSRFFLQGLLRIRSDPPSEILLEHFPVILSSISAEISSKYVVWKYKKLL